MFTPTDTDTNTDTNANTPYGGVPEIHDDRTFCAVHPTVETSLRCNKCGRYMCVRCAVRTPVGYRCKECVHQQQDTFFTATQADYLIAGAVAFGLSLPVAYILTQTVLGFLIVVIIASFPAGSLIADIAARATGRRRGRYTWMIVGGAIALTAIIVNFSLLGAVLGHPQLMIALLRPLIYTGLCVAGAVARLRYGK